MKTFLTKGDWGHSTFSAYLDVEGSFDSLRSKTTAAVSVCLTPENKIVLTKKIDGEYDLLGGRTEPGESVEETLKREAMEEGGMELSSWKYFGYYEVELSKNASKEYGDKYPQTSYILFFISHGKKVCEPYGEEIIGYEEFSILELKSSNVFDHIMLKEALKLIKHE